MSLNSRGPSATGGARLPSIPVPPSSVDAETRRWMENVREWLEVRLGVRGDAGERAVTRRELDTDLTRLTAQLGGSTSGSTSGSTGMDLEGDLTRLTYRVTAIRRELEELQNRWLTAQQSPSGQAAAMLDTLTVPNPTNLASDVKPAQVVVSWDEPSPPLVFGSELRVGTTWDTATLLWRGVGTDYKHARPANGTYKVWLAHLAMRGTQLQYSATPVSVDITVDDTIDNATPGDSVYVEYSVDGSTLWHSTFAVGDLYARWKIGVGGAWTDAFRIVGEAGTDGDYIDFIFQRSATQPATPTGDNPVGWFDAPPVADGNPLWASTGTKTAAGVLVGAWSAPVKIEGDPGATGAAAQTLMLTSTGFAFVAEDAAATTVAGPDISFTANLQNLAGTVTFTVTAYDASNVSLGLITLGGTGNANRTMTAAQFTNSGTWATKYVKVEASLSGLSDTMTVYRGDNGSDAVQAVLTNEAHTLATASDGTVTYTGSGTDIRVFEGVTELDYDGIGTANGKWTATRSVTSGTVSTPGAISESVLKAVVADHAGMSTDQAQITYTISGKTSTGASFTVTKIQSLAKSKAGASAPSLMLTATGFAFVFADQAATAALNPDQIDFTAVLQNTSGSVTWAATGYDVNDSSTGAVTLTAQTATTARLTKTNFVDGLGTSVRYVKVTATLGSLTDTMTIYRGDNGASAIQAVLSNEAHTLPADASGTVTSYAGSGTTVRTFEGTAELTYDGVGAGDGTWRISHVNTSINRGTLTDSGAYATIGDHSAMTADQASITYTIQGKSLQGNNFTIEKTQSFAKSKAGATGSTGPSGPAGDQGVNARRAYALFTISGFTAVTWDAGATLTVAGDALPGAATVSSPNAATAWTSTTQTPAAGQAMYQADGLYNPSTNQTTWNSPYLSNFRVGSLSAISADLGTITAGTITGATVQTASSGARLVMTGSTLQALNASSAALISFDNAGYAEFKGSSYNASGTGISAIAGRAGTSTNSTAVVGVYGSQEAASGGQGVMGESLAGNSNGIGVFGKAANANSTGVYAANTAATAGKALHALGKVLFNLSPSTELQLVNTTTQIRMHDNAPGVGTGYGTIIGNNGTDFYVGTTASGSADSGAVSTTPFRVVLATGQTRVTSLRVDATPNATNGGGVLTNTNSPTGHAGGALRWVTLNFNGTDYIVPCLPA